MGVVCFEDVLGPCIITAISSYQMLTFAKRTGRARLKFKVPAPQTTGDEGFVRVFRAQQNSCEFYPVFLASLWSSTLLCHQVPSCIIGVIYMVARERYFVGYSEAAEKRKPGFRASVAAIVSLNLLNVVGAANSLFTRIAGRSIFRLFCTR